MKKFIVAVLTLVMLLAISVSASAANTASFALNVPTQAISDDQLYNYHGGSYAQELAGDNTIYVKHEVTQIDADETNRIAAYRQDTQKTMGAHWHPADYCYYPCTSNAIAYRKYFTAAGRGNTNYASKYGLNTITLTGILDPDMD